jgi:two-component system cell cycle response regulator DivK
MQRRVLVIEDHPINLQLICDLIKVAGHQVITATSAEAGLRLAEVEQPDLILMDLQLPGLTGYDATRRLKARPATAAIPVVAVTAFAMRGDDVRARQAGCDAYLTKPLRYRPFIETLQRYLPAGPAGAT